MDLDFWKGRKARWAGVLLVGVALVAFAHVAILREIGAFLIIEDSLRPAAAIIALGGEPPFREMEAARLYRGGWASRVVIVRGARGEEWKALQDMGIAVEETWERSREVLIRQGVPPSAILVPKEEAAGTLEELQAAYRALGSNDALVILVTSKYHTRRVRLTWQYVTAGQSQPIVRAASGDPFDPERWWHQRRFALSVVREYLGLINYYAGFPVGANGG
jgi:uncharacterized SAM-binding protein YcdF (DUF218 family)